MATGSPRGHQKSAVLTIAVVGLTSSSQGDQGEGTGKSCLCNKFVTPHADHYFTNHPYIVNLSEFGNSVINNCHFLYWGEKVTALEDGSEVTFRIIEHTEFVEDMSLKPFSSQKPYHKRITISKLQSGGKLQYVAPNQLTLPDDYLNVSRFPDRAVSVDGFVMCVDASADFTADSHYRNDALKLISIVQGAKKPLVIAVTKCDRVTQPEVTEILSKLKKSPQVIEVSSHEGVNVDLCFLALAHIIDSRKPKVRVVPYDEGNTIVKERTARNEKLFKDMLNKKLTDFMMPIPNAITAVRKQPEWEGVAQLKGSPRCEKLIRIKMGQLHVEAVMKRVEMFKEISPEYLSTLLPSVTLEDTTESCLTTIKEHADVEEYFIHVDNWVDNNEFMYSFSNKVPLEFLEKEGKNILQEHISALQLDLKREQAKKKIRDILQNTEDLQPGVKAMVAMETLGLKEEAVLLGVDVLQKVYQERMSVIEQKCADDIHELLLERLDMFHDYTPDTKEIVEKLVDEPRMKKMELAVTKRDGIIVKHISTLEVLDRGPYYTPEILGQLENDMPSLESLQDSIKGHWSSTPDAEVFNLVILSSSSEEAAILRSDIMNQCTGADVYEYNSLSYQMRMKCCHTGNEDMTSSKFVPQGVIIIVSSFDGLEWAGSHVARNFLTYPSCSYRGMPCVMLVITEDESAECALLDQCKQLSAQLQCVLVSTHPTDLPGRLVMPEIVNSVLPSLLDNFTVTHSFLFDGPVREPEGLNFGVFCLPGDPPAVPDSMKSLLTSPQLAHYDSKSRTLYTKTALEKVHKVVSLAFYSTINARDFSSHPILGFIIFYSTDRKASFSAVKWLIPRLHPIPILLVAICGDNSSPLIEEGQKFANERGKKVEFVACHNQLEVARLAKFYSDCFYSRITSWRSQPLSEEVSARIFKRRTKNLPRPLPTPGDDFTSQTLPHNISRHSIALGDIPRHPNIPRQFATLLSSSLKHKMEASLPTPPHLLENDDEVYSDPNEVIEKVTQNTQPNIIRLTCSSPESRYKSTPEISNSVPVSVGAHFKTLPHTSSLGATDYALVPNTDTLSKLDTLTRQRRSKHGSSPISTHSSTPDSLHDDQLYSSVKDVSGPTNKMSGNHSVDDSKSHTPSPTPPPIYPKATIYDRLTPRSQRRKMNENQLSGSFEGGAVDGVYSLANGSEAKVDRKKTPESHHYSSFNNAQIQLEQLQNQLYNVAESVEVGGSPSNSLKRSESPIAIYDFVENPPTLPQPLSMQSYNVKTFDGSPSPQRKPLSPYIPPDYSSMTGDDHPSQSSMYAYASVDRTRYSLQTQSHEGTPDSIYSLAEDAPPQCQKQSLTPPRQSPLMAHRSPTPPTSRPPVPPRSSSHSTDSGNYLSRKQVASRKSPGTPTKVKQSPVTTPPLSRAIEHVTPSASDTNVIYAIPDKKATVHHVMANDNPESIYALPDKPVGRKPPQREATPIDFDEIDDDDDEEAPPLPPRNYDTSDIEDDDEQCFRSDNEDEEDDPLFKPVAPSPIGVYACVGEVMEEMENIYMNLNIIRKQQLQQHHEEPIYDSLEKVIEVVNKGAISPVPETTPPANGAVPLPISIMPTSVKMPPLSKNAIKMLKKLEKQSKKEKAKREKQEAKRKKKDEEKRKKMEKALKKGKKIKQSARQRYFESSLSSVVEEDGVPAFIKACVAIVEEEGLDSVGLYRVSGRREDILKIQDMYDQDRNIDINSLDMCVNAITGTLKSFFKVLPDPLIPENLLLPLLDIPGSNDITTQKQKMKEILSTLPRGNLKTLRFLCVHLNNVQQHQEKNKMNTSNLSIVFWPTLMRPPIMDMADPTKQLGWQLAMAKMIEHPDCVPEIE